MALSRWAEAQNHIDNKIKFVLETFLKDRLDILRVNTGLDIERLPDPKTIDVGVNSVGLGGGYNATDLFPAIACWSTSSSTTQTEFLQAQDNLTTYSIACVIGSNSADITWAMRSARLLALEALGVLEAHLPDSPGDLLGPQTIYRVDPISSSGARTLPMKTGGLYISAFEVQINVYTRVLQAYDPARAPDELDQLPHVQSLFDPRELILDFQPTGVNVGTIQPGVEGAASITSAQLAASTDLRIRGPLAAKFSIGSDTLAVNQSTFEVAAATFGPGQTALIPLGSISINTGDLWTITIKDEDTKVPSYYSVRWTVT